MVAMMTMHVYIPVSCSLGHAVVSRNRPAAWLVLQHLAFSGPQKQASISAYAGSKGRLRVIVSVWKAGGACVGRDATL